ncbi:hypothetical protein [Mesorhizobium sp. J428]|uniref:hypothetical protein n=1 Tax=Mesorhizobium sp. J428 TaxID=2898440 RepID=UPI0021514455|nr:hypothetical protein [Mesorhizobium sp. J428]MCR5859745.1 hypothetical protein [Mesorhizobium sp. J428]
MRINELARISCRGCRTERLYALKDLLTLFGDIEVDDVVYVQRWRCISCGNDDMGIDLPRLSGVERQAAKVRRISRIEYVRKVSWREE